MSIYIRHFYLLLIMYRYCVDILYLLEKNVSVAYIPSSKSNDQHAQAASTHTNTHTQLQHKPEHQYINFSSVTLVYNLAWERNFPQSWALSNAEMMGGQDD